MQHSLQVVFTRRLFVSIRVNILKASLDFYAIKTFLTCKRNSGYLLLCHKPLETIVFNPKFYEPLRSIKLSLKSINSPETTDALFFVERSVWEYVPNVCEF